MLLILTLIFSLFGIPPAQGANMDSNGSVVGTVLDVREAAMYGATVVIYNEERRFETTVDTEGQFQFQVPEGTYEIQATARNFCTASRAPFKVASKSTVTVKLALLVSPIVSRIYKEKGAHPSETDRHECPFTIERIPAGSTLKADKEVWIQFGDITKVGETNCYSGYFSEEKPQAVIVSYDLLTLYADKVCLSDKNELTAFGTISLDHGDGQVQTLNEGDALKYKGLVIRKSPVERKTSRL